MRLFRKKTAGAKLTAVASMAEQHPGANDARAIDEVEFEELQVSSQKDLVETAETGEAALYPSRDAPHEGAESVLAPFTSEIFQLLPEPTRLPDETSQATWAMRLKRRFNLKQSRALDKGRSINRPIRVFIGYLPEVTERDAMEYALGIAEKHFEQMGMAFFDAFEYAEGFAYEIHEGGDGKAYLPSILRYFEESGPYDSADAVSVVVKTATRRVEVQKLHNGLTAIILPEQSEKPETDWLTSTTSMQPALNKRTGFFVIGAALFTTGFIAMLVTSVLTRYQPYEPAPEMKVEYLNPANLPRAQWGSIERVPAGSYIKALRYRNNKWEPPEVTTEAPAPGPAASVGAASSANDGKDTVPPPPGAAPGPANQSAPGAVNPAPTPRVKG